MMTRRNQRKFSQQSHNYQNDDSQLVKKLDIRRLNYFRYDAKEVLTATELDPKVWNPLLASIVTKASRISIRDATEYIKKLENDDVLDQKPAKALINLLEKYKRWR